MKTNIFFLILIIAFGMSACKSDDDSDDRIGNWVERSVFDGRPRSSAASFSIGSMGYMGTGYDGDDYLSDFWAYDMNGDFWTQKADFPGSPRSAAVGFSVGNKGYLGTGFDGDEELSDFYSYDETTNTWSPIAEYPSTPRRNAIAFNSSDYGFVGTGFDGENDKKDFWKYNANEDSWTEVAGFGGNKRRNGAAFVIGDYAYIGTGSSNGVLLEDFWEFDMVSGAWRRLTDLDDDDEDIYLLRSGASCFSIGSKGYLTFGNDGTGDNETVWEYNPITDQWDQKTSFEDTPRENAVVFYDGNKAYIALGKYGSLYLDDTQEFFPNQEEDEDD